MLTGLARDGGLYVPETFPTLTQAQIASFAGKPYEEVAFEVMKPFVGDTFTDEEFKAIIQRAYAGFAHDAKCPVVQLSENHFLSWKRSKAWMRLICSSCIPTVACPRFSAAK